MAEMVPSDLLIKRGSSPAPRGLLTSFLQHPLAGRSCSTGAPPGLVRRRAGRRAASPLLSRPSLRLYHRCAPSRFWQASCAGSTVSLRRSSPQVRGAPRHSWQARGDDVCTAPRLASPAFASSSSPVLATQIRHGLQTGSSSFLGAAAGETLGYRLTLLNFKVRGQLLLLDLCSELAEFDALGASPSSRTGTCTVPALSPDPVHAFRSSCVLLATLTQPPCLFVGAAPSPRDGRR